MPARPTQPVHRARADRAPYRPASFPPARHRCARVDHQSMTVWRRASCCGMVKRRRILEMARIPLFPLEPMTAEQRRVYDAIVAGPRGSVEGPLRVALHQPALADAWQALGAELRYRAGLVQRLREL